MDKEWLQHLPLDPIDDIRSVSGGDVNEAYTIESAGKKYFLLVQPQATKEFFLPEAAGLEDLYEAGVTVPKVYNIGEIDADAYLLISFLEEGNSRNYTKLARMIAKMHRVHHSEGLFGYNYPYQGAKTTFDNDWTESWSELFVERRMDLLRDKIVATKLWNVDQENNYEEVRSIMIEELANHKSKPSLLHGDLWGGNHMFMDNGEPALFDPHPLYGDREFDIGITTSFGVYPQEFYQAYQSFYPMAEGYEKRLEFYRLYIFMVHLYKFGSSYAKRVTQIMEKFLT